MGKVINNYKISLMQTMLNGFSLDKAVENQIKTILQVMPEGTVFIERRDDTIYSTYIPVLLVFEHPIFPDLTEIELTYQREIAINLPDAAYKEFSVLTQVKYYNPDKTKRYHIYES